MARGLHSNPKFEQSVREQARITAGFSTARVLLSGMAANWNSDLYHAVQSCKEGFTSLLEALSCQVTLDLRRPNFPQRRFGDVSLGPHVRYTDYSPKRIRTGKHFAVYGEQCDRPPDWEHNFRIRRHPGRIACLPGKGCINSLRTTGPQVSRPAFASPRLCRLVLRGVPTDDCKI